MGLMPSPTTVFQLNKSSLGAFTRDDSSERLVAVSRVVFVFFVVVVVCFTVENVLVEVIVLLYEHNFVFLWVSV